MAETQEVQQAAPTTEQAAKPPSPTALMVEDAVSAAEGTRNAARWIASSLGAIPGLAIVASVIRAPGDAGFDSSDLTWGIALAAAGALIGILAFADVLTPAAIEEKDLEGIDVKRIPGHPFTSYRELANASDGIRRRAGDAEIIAGDAEEDAKLAEQAAINAEIELAKSEEKLKAAPDNQALKADVEAARTNAKRLRDESNAADAGAKEKAAQLEEWDEQLIRREAIRTNLYRLAGADRVRQRYSQAAGLSVFAVGLVAAGFIFLGKAPNPKTEDAKPVTLVRFALTPAGKEELGCQAEAVSSLRVGGTDNTPEVITLPSSECPNPRQLPFPTAKPKPLGTVIDPEGGP